MHVKMYSCEWLYLVSVYCRVWLGDEAVRVVSHISPIH